MEVGMQTKKAVFVEPDVKTYDREELLVEFVFTQRPTDTGP